MPNPDLHSLPEHLARLLPALTRRARTLSARPEDAADLAQEAALRLWQHHLAGAQIEDPEAYAMTTLRNLARSAWRGQRSFDALEEDTAAAPPDAPRLIAYAELSAAIDRLPPAQAKLLHLVEEGETSPARLADITGNPVGTVMSRLARARASLRAEMGLSKKCSVTTLYEESLGA
ncbi:RNA polymerase sigma factor [Thalassococcus sp. S3]|uniref:RNA polymerase sigma factor n=1 Tax=Thalassococcus sp. S3 TaxID=2017482 RepID=UPI0010244EF4|nr:RNA polymerase sigma factor [Thalassococcus sp. S3]QBF31637.1 hypothetical protein CFI11_10465 [Thalassococcus sp. S3]